MASVTFDMLYNMKSANFDVNEILSMIRRSQAALLTLAISQSELIDRGPTKLTQIGLFTPVAQIEQFKSRLRLAMYVKSDTDRRQFDTNIVDISRRASLQKKLRSWRYLNI